jgi:large subunit ribosomal protein L25
MKVLEIQGIKRESFGKKANKILRKEDNVPCVLYGGKENIHFYAHENLFKELIYSPNVYIVKLVVGEQHFDAILQEIQYHPVTDKIFHIDFFEVYPDKKVTIGVPIKVFGHSIGVKEGGKLILEHRKLKVRGLFHDLPDTIEINVEDLSLGKSIKVGELPRNKFRFIEPDNIVVVSVKLTRVSKDAEVAEGAEVVAEEGATDETKKVEQTK